MTTPASAGLLIRTAPGWAEVRARIRRQLRIAALGVLIAAGTACALEVLLRLVHRAPPVERVYQWSQSISGYGLIPSRRVEYLYRGRRLVITVDANGRRVVPGAPAAAPHTLYVVGDSQAFGWGLSDEETIAARLQQQLGRRWRVVNLGVPGYGPFAYAEILGKLPDDGPAVVVQAELNDFHDAAFAESSLQARCGFLVTRSALVDSMPCWLLSSHLLARGADLLIALGGSLPAPMGFQRHARVTARVLQYRISGLYDQARSARHHPVLVTTIPWDAAVLPERLRNYRPVLARAERMVALPSDLDVEPVLGAARETPDLFQAADSHLGAGGAAVVARRIAREVLLAESPVSGAGAAAPPTSAAVR